MGRPGLFAPLRNVYAAFAIILFTLFRGKTPRYLPCKESVKAKFYNRRRYAGGISCAVSDLVIRSLKIKFELNQFFFHAHT